MNLRIVLRDHCADIALLVGNGLNQYGAAEGQNSWNSLLVSLGQQFLPPGLRNIPSGVSLTEFFDVVELKTKFDAEKPLQKRFCKLMESWKAFDHHSRIVHWAMRNNAPLLTTNFERVLADVAECTLYPSNRKGLTDYYPWESYYSPEELDDATRGFAIWHINGMKRYHRSIRLGLTHYMGSVARARSWLHDRDDRGLFEEKNHRNWKGRATWLHILFNKSIVIFGLGLEENEVFLRWLLIERAKYYRKFPSRKKKAWYVHPEKINGTGKDLYLRGVGVDPIVAESYDEIYDANTWK